MKKQLSPLVALFALGFAPSVASAGQADGASQLEKAHAILEEGRAVKSEALLDAAIASRKLAPEPLARALLYRALARQKAGRLDAAIDDYTAALMIDALDPRTRARALYNRGLIWRQRGQPGQAMEDFTSALYLDPQLSAAYFARAGLLLAAGQQVFALADYDKALKYGFRQPHLVHYARALIFMRRDERGAAKRALYAALRERPDYAPARQRLAALLNGREGVRLAALTRNEAAPRKVRRAAPLKVAAVNLRKTPRAEAVEPPRVVERTLASRRDDARIERSGQAPTKPLTARKPSLPAVQPEKKPQETAALQARAEKPVITPVAAPATESNIKTAAPEAQAPASVEKRTRWTGWAIQIASQRSEEAAWAHWEKVRGKVKRVIRQPRAIVEKAEIAGRGTFYRLRLVGYADRRKAIRACRGLKRKGASCLVIRAGA